MHDIFISYSTDDKDVMLEVCRQFEAAGLECWYDKRNITLGDRWMGAITEAIEASKVFVLIYSENSNKSKEVRKEVLIADNSDCVIVPFCISDCEMDSNLAYCLKSLQWLDATSNPVEECVASLVERVCELLGKDDKEEDSVAVEDGEIEYEDIGDEIEDNSEEIKKLNREIIKYSVLLVLCIATIIGCIVWWIVDYIDYKNSSYPRIKMESLSSFDEYIYPFSGFSMFSSNYTVFFAENKETGSLSLINTSNCSDIFTLKDTFEDKKHMQMMYNEDSNIAYFINTHKYTVKICNLEKGVWVGDEIQLNLSETEGIASYGYTKGSTLNGVNLNENLDLLLYDYAYAKDCYSRILRINSKGEILEYDISQYKLTSYICGSTDGGNFFLMWDENENVKVLDFNTMSVPELTYEELKADYFPYLSANGTTISPDKKYVCRNIDLMGAPNITLWDIETGNKLLKKTLSKSSTVFFTKESRLIYYSAYDWCVREYNPETGEDNVILDTKYFLSEYKELFGSTLRFYYNHELDMCFMLCTSGKGDDTKMYIVAFDRDGNPLGLSDEMDWDREFFGNVTTDDVNVCVVGENIFLSANAGCDYEEDIITIIYRGKYQKNKDGEIEFLYY